MTLTHDECPPEKLCERCGLKPAVKYGQCMACFNADDDEWLEYADERTSDYEE